jgi:cobalt-zinc-cadmium efflux system outer membrane protein
VRLVVSGLVALLLARQVSAQTPTRFTYAEALQRALAANPAILAAQTRRAIGTAGVAVAGERLNPEGRVELDRDVPHQAYTVAIPIELGGKRGRRIDVADAEAKAAEAEIAQLIAQTRNAVRRAYSERVVAEARVALLDDLQSIAARARDAARQRFEAGSSPRLELLQAELALSQAQNESVGAHGASTAARVRFNALLGMPAAAETSVAVDHFEAVPSADAAIARARQSSTELAMLDRRLDAQRARVALAKAMQTPDLTPEASWTHGFENGADFQNGWKAAVAITLPIFTTHKAGVALEESTLAQLTAERTSAEMRIAADVAAAVAVAEAQRQEVLRYRDDILPQATQVESMADDAYRLGQTGIAAYLQALQATRDVRLRALQSEADLQAALADLEQAIGAPLHP